MSDVSANVAVTSVAKPSLRARILAHPMAAWREGRLGWRAACFIGCTAALGVGYYFYRWEGGAPNLFFVWSCTLLVTAAIIFATGRVLAAAILVPAMIALVDRASVVKHSAMNMVVHAYDIVFFLTSPATLKFLWAEYRAPLVALFGAIAAAIMLARLLHKLDATRIDRRYSAAGIAIFALATSIAADIKGERRNTQPYWEDLVISSFYSSWAETVETLWRGSLIDAAKTAPGQPFAVPSYCEARGKLPHIFLIHEESVVPPEYFPQISYDKSLDGHFRSGDGKLHRMRVETYGGASWLTEFSVLAGVSTDSFGGMRPFVQSLMAGKVRDTLPERLASCGYRNTVFYPLSRNFVSNAKFYQAVGMPEIFDMHDQGAKTGNERDRFYYANAMNLMQNHLKTSSEPLFAFILTMATHAPYVDPYMPEVLVRGGGPGTNPEMSEYLRRLGMAHMDYEEFKRDLKRRFPNEPILIVRYGDHHPIATRSYLGQADARSAEDVKLPQDGLGYVTYYAVEGINYSLPKPLPAPDTVDVPYLGTILLEQAGMPLSGSYGERKRLMSACDGHYFSCKSETQILSFHRRLIDSGLLDAR